MATEYTQRRQRRQDAASKRAEEAAKKAGELENLEEGQEISAETAEKLQPQIGNQALAALLSNANSMSSGGVELEEEEEQVEEVIEGEDFEEGVELESPQLGGGGGGGSDGAGGAGADPWDMGLLFGGDDDDEDDEGKPTRRHRLRLSPRRTMAGPGDPYYGDQGPGALEDEDVEAIDELLGPALPRPTGPAQGDEVYAAVLPSLFEVAALGRPSFDPEDLVYVAGPSDPLGRPVELARFLAEAAESARARSVARVLAHAIAHMSPAGGGHAAAVARMSALAVCAEAHEGGGARTDRAVALSLAIEAWDDAVETARKAVSSGRLYAPELVRRIIDAPDGDGASRLPRPSRLGGRALARIVPEGYIPSIPDLDVRLPAALDLEDDDLLSADAALSLFTNGENPLDRDEDPEVTADHLAPILDAANHLVNAIGRAQVEFTAAAVAVLRVRPGVRVNPVLIKADQALRQLARSVFSTGGEVDRLKGLSLSELGDTPGDAVSKLRASVLALLGLRTWAFESLAGAMDA